MRINKADTPRAGGGAHPGLAAAPVAGGPGRRPPGDGDPGWDGAGAGGPRLYRRAGPDPGPRQHRPPAGADGPDW